MIPSLETHTLQSDNEEIGIRNIQFTIDNLQLHSKWINLSNDEWKRMWNSESKSKLARYNFLLSNKWFQWFILNGTFVQKDIVERRVVENVDELLESGKYGREIVITTINQCTNQEKKNVLNEKYQKSVSYLLC